MVLITMLDYIKVSFAPVSSERTDRSKRLAGETTRDGTGSALSMLRSVEPADLVALGHLLRPHACMLVRDLHHRYQEALGSSTFFSRTAFHLWQMEALHGMLTRLREGSRNIVVDWQMSRARRLRQMGLGFDEASVLVQLQRQTCGGFLERCELGSGDRLAAAESLSALSQLQQFALACAYFRHPGRSEPAAQTSMVEEVARIQSEYAAREWFCGMVGRSLPMQRLYETLTAAAQTRSAVLLVGESGTGKELAARAIHRLSGDAMGRYVPVNCATLPRELMDSELFGYMRGAFSGAGQDREGLFHAADCGSLFLDEITELPLDSQAKLLRVLQEQFVRRVGSTREDPISVRVIASTNVPLMEARDGGRLRRDLFYRLQGFVVTLPPLRERLEDVPLLTKHFIRQINSANTGACQGIANAAMTRLQSHHWPGNVRELEMAVTRSVATSDAPVIRTRDLPQEIRTAGAPTPAAEPEALSLKEVERRAIAQALQVTQGNKSKASRILGISRKQLYVKIQRYGLGQPV